MVAETYLISFGCRSRDCFLRTPDGIGGNRLDRHAAVIATRFRYPGVRRIFQYTRHIGVVHDMVNTLPLLSWP
jgi:hypothetical protein